MVNLKIPLILKLKKAGHKEIARAQDIIIEELYKIFNNAVIHGGTAIWRVYDGNRFSEDIDVYIPKNIDKINDLFKNLEKRGFITEKKKITGNSLYSVLKFNRTSVRLEALFKTKKGILGEYETSEGNKIIIYTLTSEELIKEKIQTYLKRFKVRDFYDIFFLLKYVKNKKEIINDLKMFIKKFKEPIDEQELKILIMDGLIPNIKKMLDYINYWI